MAEKSEEETPATSTPDFVKESDSGKDPAEFQTEEEEKPANPAAGEEENPRESKRRRKCPAALDKFEEFETSNRNFSFSFDTKNPSGGTPESTPKFGSFNLVGNLGLLGTINSTQIPEEEEEECDQISLGFAEHNKGEEEEETEEEQQSKTEIENSIPIVVRTAD